MLTLVWLRARRCNTTCGGAGSGAVSPVYFDDSGNDQSKNEPGRCFDKKVEASGQRVWREEVQQGALEKGYRGLAVRVPKKRYVVTCRETWVARRCHAAR